MKTNAMKGLFGGALIGAGLCSSAMGADVDWNFGSGAASNSTVNISDFLSGGGWSADAGSGTHSIAGTFGLDVAAYGASNGLATGYGYGSFSVATDTTLLLGWDIAGGYAEIIGPTVLNSFRSNGGGDSGSLEFTIIHGVSYTEISEQSRNQSTFDPYTFLKLSIRLL